MIFLIKIKTKCVLIIQMPPEVLIEIICQFTATLKHDDLINKVVTWYYYWIVMSKAAKTFPGNKIKYDSYLGCAIHLHNIQLIVTLF